MTTEARYQMDDFTFQHLTHWCDTQGPWASEHATECRNAIVYYLERLSVKDAEYSINHGWSHVARLVFDA